MENKPNPLVRWDERYSSTMEDDKQGRWARVAFAGSFKNIGFFRRKVCRWEIAWIKKVEINDVQAGFTIDYKFPSNGKRHCDTLEQAKKEVEKSFTWFLKMCLRDNMKSTTIIY